MENLYFSISFCILIKSAVIGKWSAEIFRNTLRFACPEFLPSQLYGKRNHLYEKLERMDMLRRRERLEIPEFYVGSILAVTMSVPYTASKLHRFVGICIQREWRGLRHYFMLRNVIHNEGFEIRYDLYNPTLVSIEVLKLEKRLDDELLYLRDALPKYSTFPFDMEPQPHQPGTPVPVNELKVSRWELRDFKGIQDFWHLVPLFRKLRYRKVRFMPWEKFDLIADYKINATADDFRDFVRQVDQEYDHDAEKSPQKAS
ncbi:Ribosomal L19 domain containing protein [Trichuris trichiura]|uniref:Large ribosomal subunit protein bL19m n=1 Tax=Trichuris trichiura TaxID=36087 RepID=A0A077YWL9_TRITR|nr:Ribosomal L19 domain containing protein [Trichuris trichiura]